MAIAPRIAGGESFESSWNGVPRDPAHGHRLASTLTDSESRSVSKRLRCGDDEACAQRVVARTVPLSRSAANGALS